MRSNEINYKLMPFWMKWLLPKKIEAITVNSHKVFFRSDKNISSTKLRAHHRCHCNQFKRNGWLLFVIKYSIYLLRFGLKENPYERECREYANRYMASHHVHSYTKLSADGII